MANNMGVEVVEEGPGTWAVRLQLGDEAQELAPLQEPVARHVADLLRLKLALDAGAPPPHQVELWTPFEHLAGVLEDLRRESIEQVMEAMARAAAGGDVAECGVEFDVGDEMARGAAEHRLTTGPEPGGVTSAGAAAGMDADALEGGGSVGSGAGAGRAVADAGLEARVLDAASDQTDLALAHSAELPASERHSEQVHQARQAQQAQHPSSGQVQQASPEHAQRMQGGPPAGPAEAPQQAAPGYRAGSSRLAADAGGPTSGPPAPGEPPGEQHLGRQQATQGEQGQGGQRAKQGNAQEEADAELARRLQCELHASERYASRQRRSAAPAEGSLQIPGVRKWARGMAAAKQQEHQQGQQGAGKAAPPRNSGQPGQQARASGTGSQGGAASQLEEGGTKFGAAAEQAGPAQEGAAEAAAAAEFRGVALRQRGGTRRWQASISATLNRDEKPTASGQLHPSLPVCECGTQEEAAVARDLALLWREQRLGYMPGALEWVPEEYSFKEAGYHQAVDVAPRLASCKALPALRVLLGELCQAGRLAELAATLERNPFGFIDQHPQIEPCTEAALADAKRRYRCVQGGAGSATTPWKPCVPVPPALRPAGPKPKLPDLGAFGTAAQAAVAADLVTVWREKMLTARGEGGDMAGQPYNFPLQGYQEDSLVWQRVRAATEEGDMRLLLQKLRDCGRLEVIAQRQLATQRVQQGGAAGRAQPLQEVSPASAQPAQGRRKRGHDKTMAAVGHADPGSSANAATAAAAKGSGGSGKRRKAAGSPEAAGSGGTAAAAAAAAGGSAAGGLDPADPLPLFEALTKAASLRAAQREGLTAALCGPYLIALQAKPAQLRRWEVGCLRMWVDQGKWEAVVGTMRAAIKAADLEA